MQSSNRASIPPSPVACDPLTSLPNRAAFWGLLQGGMRAARRTNRPLALLLLGLDGFREVNHSLGPKIGDLLLQRLAARLGNLVGRSDALARVGGDEFAILVADPGGPKGASDLAARILEGLEEPFDIAGLKLSARASIGVAVAPQHGNQPEVLFQRADIAMHAAKRTKSGHALYAPEQNQNSRRQLTLMGELRRALVRDELFLVYQPKLNIRTNRFEGVEALVRWRHPELGIVLPGSFIPLAEQTGLIMPLTLWVLHEALRQCRLWRDEGLGIVTAVNLSAWNLQSQDLPQQIAGLLNSCAVEPERLQLEITESAIMVDPARAVETLKRMAEMGLKFSIDDFGTGYSSLAYLKRLPVHEIKVDRSFISSMAVDRDDVAIVQSTIELGHNLGLAVVAEGVEDAATMQRLADLRCDFAQGHYMSEPVPAESLRPLLRSPRPLGPNGLQRPPR